MSFLISPHWSCVSVVGSLPLPKDVKVMVEDHKIGAVINMTEEYEGESI